MPNLKITNQYPRKERNACFFFTDDMAIRDAHNAIKGLRRGKTIVCQLPVTLNGLDELIDSYSNTEYEITATNNGNDFYRVTVHRFTRLEKLIMKWQNRKSGRRSSQKNMKACSFEATEW